MKSPEMIVGAIVFVIGLYVFEVNNAFRLGEYSVQALFWIGLSITIYRIVKNKIQKRVSHKI